MNNVVSFPEIETVYEMADDCPKCRSGLDVVAFSVLRLTEMYCPVCGEKMRITPVTDDPPEAA